MTKLKITTRLSSDIIVSQIESKDGIVFSLEDELNQRIKELEDQVCNLQFNSILDAAEIGKLKTWQQEAVKIYRYADTAWGATDKGWRDTVIQLMTPLIKQAEAD